MIDFEPGAIWGRLKFHHLLIMIETEYKTGREFVVGNFRTESRPI